MTLNSSIQGALFIQFGILNVDTLEQCVERQRQLKEDGRNVPLHEIVVELGFADKATVQRVANHGRSVTLYCDPCNQKYFIDRYDANKNYKCEGCRGYITPEEEPDTTALFKTFTTSKQGGNETGDPLIGNRVGDFLVEKRIGRGGVGMVYLADRVADGKKAALKILPETFSNDPIVAKRFRREAMLATRLDHPGIAAAMGAGRHGNSLYLATEFVGERTLEEDLPPATQMDVGKAVPIAVKLLNALQHAHDHEIAHRDVKPTNIIMNESGDPVLIDFGLAHDNAAQTMLTMQGQILGTPSFMSPEQTEGNLAGTPSDIYSTGVLLFRMLAGKKPFEGSDIRDLLENIATKDTPSIRELNPEVPESVERVIRRMMSKKPEHRHASAGEAARALEDALRDPDRKEKGPEERKTESRSLNPWLLAAALAVGAGIAAAIVLLG